MITYINNNDAELVAKYTQLFSDAESDLNDGTAIQDLPSYFANLSRLAPHNAKFVRLPLDEDVFVIDANKRAINVPKAFANAGISVKNDKIAEIVYFKINRFFDIADLSTKNIVIEWENAAGQKGLTAAFQKDCIVEDGEDFLVFGWPLDTTITSAAGTVKFAVRFYTLKDGAIDYSFSTMAASAKILATLEVDLDSVEIEDLNQIVLNRLIPAESDLAVPTFSLNLLSDANLDENGELELEVELNEVENNRASYQWYKDGAKLAGAGNVSSITVNELGEYYVIATNTITVVDSLDASGNALATHTESASAKSNVCVIPAPSAIEVIEDLPEGILITNHGTDEEQDNYAALQMVVAKPNGVASVVAKWADDAEAEEDAWHVANGNQLKEAISCQEVDNTLVITLKPTVEHLYKIEVTNTRNGQSEILDSQICRITYPAVTPVITIKYDNASISGDTVNLVEGKALSASVNSSLVSDRLEYQWCEATEAEGDDEAIRNNATSESFIPTDAGEFYCIVKNILNGSEASAESAHITVIRRR